MTRRIATLLLLPFLLTACKSDAAASKEADRKEAVITSGFTQQDMESAARDLCKDLSQAHARGDVGGEDKPTLRVTGVSNRTRDRIDATAMASLVEQSLRSQGIVKVMTGEAAVELTVTGEISSEMSSSGGSTQTDYSVTLKVIDTTGAIVASSFTRIRKVRQGG